MQAMKEAGASRSIRRAGPSGTPPRADKVSGRKALAGEIEGTGMAGDNDLSSPAARLISPDVRERYLELSRNKAKACSCCGAEAGGGGEKFKVCSTCRRKAYCSAACQHQDWKEGGHKRSCRPQKDFRTDDVVVAVGIQSKPELNGQLMVVVGPASEGRLQVMDASGKSISLHADKLRLVVPVEEREDVAVCCSLSWRDSTD